MLIVLSSMLSFTASLGVFLFFRPEGRLLATNDVFDLSHSVPQNDYCLNIRYVIQNLIFWYKLCVVSFQDY